MRFVPIFRTHIKTAILLTLILVIYFLFRLPNLTYQPIFADEAIYIRWAQVMKAEPTLRFLPLTDGKTPLFMWAMMPVFKVVENPLLAGRVLAVFSGLGTLIGVFLLATIFFNKRVGLLAAFLVATTPYMVFFDRMALVDTLLAAFTTWSILIALLLVKYKRIDLAMVLGFLMGGGILTKTPGMFNLVMMPIAALTVNFFAKDWIKQILKVGGLFTIAIVIALAIYNALRLGPGFSSLSSRNSDYVRNPMDLLKNPLDPFIPHLRDLTSFWSVLLGPIVIILIIGIIFAVLKRNKYAITIFLIGLGPLLIQMCLLQTFTARYLLFSVPPFLIISAFGLDNLLGYLKKNTHLFTVGLVSLLLLWPLYFTFKLTTDIENAPLPDNERRGYLEDWTSGYGLPEIDSYLDEESKKGLVIVGTEGSFGTLPDGLQIYFDKNRSVVFKPGKSQLTNELRAEASRSATFYVANKSRVPQQPENVELIKSFPKAMPRDSKNTQDVMLLYKVLPGLIISPQ
jgi:4-amino-4-deoxy-L-arabinose transferase-like glycosyltransferase